MWSPPSATTRACSGSVTRRASASAPARSAVAAVAGSSPFFRSISLERKSGLPPSRMSVPRPAMLVAIVTAASRPAWATLSASRSWYVAVVALRKLFCFGPGRAGHAGEPRVHPEVVLTRDRRERPVLALGPYALLRLDGLMEAVRPPAAGHEQARELVHDDDLAVLVD